MIIRCILTLLITATFVTPLGAQAEKVAIRTLAFSSAPFPNLWVMDASAPVALPFSKIQPSEPLRLNLSNPLRIYKGELNDKNQPADTAPTLVPLPSGSSILLLGWMNGETPRFLPIPDSFASAKHDDWLVINGSSLPVAVQIGAKTKPTTIPPSSHLQIRVTAPVNEGAAVIIASQSDKGWKTIYSTYWPIYPDKRCLVVIAQDGKKMRVNVISDEFKLPEVPKP
jgi:hypothetical protein